MILGRNSRRFERAYENGGARPSPREKAAAGGLWIGFHKRPYATARRVLGKEAARGGMKNELA